MSDKVFVTGLSLHAYHGVMPFEGKVGQTFTIDLALSIDLSAAARSDKVAGHSVLRQGGGMRERGVLRAEIPADRSGCRPRRRRGAGAFPRVREIEVTIHKPHAPVAATFSDVGVTLTRTRGGAKL